MVTWKERLVALGLAGGSIAACTLNERVMEMNQTPDPCFSTPDPVQCSDDRAAGRCTNVPDNCCGKPDSTICRHNACDWGGRTSADNDCCKAPDPTACFLAWCSSPSSIDPAYAGCPPLDGGAASSPGDDGGNGGG